MGHLILNVFLIFIFNVALFAAVGAALTIFGAIPKEWWTGHHKPRSTVLIARPGETVVLGTSKSVIKSLDGAGAQTNVIMWGGLKTTSPAQWRQYAV